MTETPPPEEWLLTTTAIPYWAIALVLLIAVVIIAIFNVQAGQPSSNPSNIQKRFGLITWSRRAAHIIIGLWGCALAMLMGAFFLIPLKLIQEILDASNQDTIRHLAIALPAVAAANAGLIALPITLNRLQLTNRQTLAEEEGLITDRINAAFLGLGAEKTVKDTVNGQVLERTEPNIEVRVGAILALERIAKKNLDVHVQIMEIFTTYLSENSSAAELVPTSVLEQIQPPRLDNQIIFNVIGRRTSQQRNREKQDLYKPTFDRINFSHAKLSGLDFSHSNFLCCYFYVRIQRILIFINVCWIIAISKKQIWKERILIGVVCKPVVLREQIWSLHNFAIAIVKTEILTALTCLHVTVRAFIWLPHFSVQMMHLSQYGMMQSFNTWQNFK